MRNQSVSSRLVSLKTELVQMTNSITEDNCEGAIMGSPLTKGNVTFSVLEFTSLVMFAATGYNKVKHLARYLSY